MCPGVKQTKLIQVEVRNEVSTLKSSMALGNGYSQVYVIKEPHVCILFKDKQLK
jgi:hypothetical protein